MSRFINGVMPIWILVGLLCLGCGGPKQPSADEAADITGKDQVTELAEMLKFLAKENKPMPKSEQDLAAIEPIFPLSAGKLASGELVYAWNTPLKEGAEAAVLAHNSDADSNGGWVLFQDGKVSRLSAADFGSAKKLTKPKKK
ncbi:MAG: hypothetical protein U0905_12745 [Pirellulales bacterium]